MLWAVRPSEDPSCQFHPGRKWQISPADSNEVHVDQDLNGCSKMCVHWLFPTLLCLDSATSCLSGNTSMCVWTKHCFLNVGSEDTSGSLLNLDLLGNDMWLLSSPRWKREGSKNCFLLQKKCKTVGSKPRGCSTQRVDGPLVSSKILCSVVLETPDVCLPGKSQKSPGEDFCYGDLRLSSVRCWHRLPVICYVL